MKNHVCTGIAALLIAACVVAAPASAKTVKNTATNYITQSKGGNGLVFFPIPIGKPGAYQISYTADFEPQSNTLFGCTLLLTHLGNQTSISQSTAASVEGGGLGPGVNGSATLSIAAGDEIEARCGKVTGDWTWFGVPLHVTVLRIDSVEAVKIH